MIKKILITLILFGTTNGINAMFSEAALEQKQQDATTIQALEKKVQDSLSQTQEDTPDQALMDLKRTAVHCSMLESLTQWLDENKDTKLETLNFEPLDTQGQELAKLPSVNQDLVRSQTLDDPFFKKMFESIQHIRRLQLLDSQKELLENKRDQLMNQQRNLASLHETKIVTSTHRTRQEIATITGLTTFTTQQTTQK